VCVEFATYSLTLRASIKLNLKNLENRKIKNGNENLHHI